MQANALPSRYYEFNFPDRDTLVLVEATPAAVIIRATRDTFSEKRKRFFIHELAAEGFIAEDYEWHSLAGTELSRGVRWLVDPTWLKVNPAVTACARRFMVRLLVGGFALWLVLMNAVFLHAFR